MGLQALGEVREKLAFDAVLSEEHEVVQDRVLTANLFEQLASLQVLALLVESLILDLLEHFEHWLLLAWL